MRFLAFFAVVSVVIFASCVKGHEAINPATPSILQYISQDTSLSLLNTAVGLTQLDTAMAAGGPYTVFAPSDSAFLAAGLTGDSMKRMDPLRLLRILEYNIIEGRVSAADVPGFLKQQFNGLNPQYKPFVTKNYYGIFLNGIPVTKGNIELGDGVVHITSRVAIPPTGSELDLMDQQPNLHFMAALARNVYVLRLLVADPNPNNPYLGIAYANPSYLTYYGNTLLVPTDSAFRAYGYADTTALIKDSVSALYNFYCESCQGQTAYPYLANNILTGFDFTSDFKGQIQIGGNSAIQFRYFGGLTTTLDGFGFTAPGIALNNPVRIVKPDMVASNGVIQVINQVFLTQ